MHKIGCKLVISFSETMVQGKVLISDRTRVNKAMFNMITIVGKQVKISGFTSLPLYIV